MLVLSRKVNQEIVIDGNIRIRVVHVGEGKVRIGVDAPETVGIRRGELADRTALPVESSATPSSRPETRDTAISRSFTSRPVTPQSAACQSAVPNGLAPVVAKWGPGPCVLPLLDLQRLDLNRFDLKRLPTSRRPR